MDSSDERLTRAQPRREFLGQIAASAIVLAGPGLSTAHAQTAAAGAPSLGAPGAPATAGSAEWDDSWVGRLTAKHKAVFDSPEIEDGLALQNVVGYINGMRDVLGAGPRDVQAVLVVRHNAVAMAFNDAMWSKYEIGKDKKVRDSATGDWARQNPYVGGIVGAGEPTQESDRPSATFSWLSARGHILLACDLATNFYAGTLARHVGGDRGAVYQELKANLIPGVILQPTGVYAALRAQEAGCAYVRCT